MLKKKEIPSELWNKISPMTLNFERNFLWSVPKNKFRSYIFFFFQIPYFLPFYCSNRKFTISNSESSRGSWIFRKHTFTLCEMKIFTESERLFQRSDPEQWQKPSHKQFLTYCHWHNPSLKISSIFTSMNCGTLYCCFSWRWHKN